MGLARVACRESISSSSLNLGLLIIIRDRFLSKFRLSFEETVVSIFNCST